VIVPILAISIFAQVRWEFFRNVFPLPLYLQIVSILDATAAFSSYLFFPALFAFCFLPTSRVQRPYRGIILLIGTLLGIPMCCCFSVRAAMVHESILNSAQLDQHHYYLTVQIAFGNQSRYYTFFKCNEKDLECEMIYDLDGGSFAPPEALIVDPGAHEINFYRGAGLVYTYGPHPHEYKFIDSGMMDTYFLNLYSYEMNSVQEFVIVKCYRKDYQCISPEILPFRYSAKNFKKANLVSDESVKEIKLLVDDKVIFNYDTAPHCQVEGCIIINK
jgi:hypothetical protein